MEGKQVEVEFTPSASELLVGSWAVVRISPAQWLLTFGPPLLALVMFAVFWWVPVPVPTLYYLLATSILLLVPALMAWNLFRALRQCKALCPMRYRIDVQGLQVSNRTAELQQQWAAIRRVRRLNGFLLLFFDHDKAYCIPLSRMAAGDDEAVLAMARTAGVRRVAG